jgi:hypothetical protein
MAQLLLPSAIFGFALIMQGCAVYPYPYGTSVAYYGQGPYYGFNYGYRPYGYYGYRPYGHFGWGGGHYWGGHGWRGHGWR